MRKLTHTKKRKEKKEGKNKKKEVIETVGGKKKRKKTRTIWPHLAYGYENEHKPDHTMRTMGRTQESKGQLRLTWKANAEKVLQCQQTGSARYQARTEEQNRSGWRRLA